ncbi:hypothetical protein [Bacillus sp. FJAT-47783]|uniref:hypothetical protein n=1 Tax=Bacillus sp. FJAT-47783 TaxID=2922712 RepID=UPI001FAC3828|nr:hypothetical protein [Bacillus sp. FJAT-47783]
MAKIKYQVCASCIHFFVEKKDKGVTYHCQRLGYETKPNYSFSCWTPKREVVELMRKRGDRS